MGETCRHDESRWINLHVAKHATASQYLDSVFGEGPRRGILVIVPNTALVTFWRDHGAGRRKVKWFRSRGDGNDALKSVRM